jgi:hypothetical protein
MIALWATPSSKPAPNCPVVYLESAGRGNISGRRRISDDSIDRSINELCNLMGID